MRAWLVVEVVMAVIVAHSDRMPRDIYEREGYDPVPPPTFWPALLRALLWPVTLHQWLRRRCMAQLWRLGGILWFLVAASWLVTFLTDRSGAPLPLVLQAVMMYTVWSTNALFYRVTRRHVYIFRILCWPVAVNRWFRDPDACAGLNHATLTVWYALTASWFLGLVLERLS